MNNSTNNYSGNSRVIDNNNATEVIYSQEQLNDAQAKVLLEYHKKSKPSVFETTKPHFARKETSSDTPSINNNIINESPVKENGTIEDIANVQLKHEINLATNPRSIRNDPIITEDLKKEIETNFDTEISNGRFINHEMLQKMIDESFRALDITDPEDYNSLINISKVKESPAFPEVSNKLKQFIEIGHQRLNQSTNASVDISELLQNAVAFKHQLSQAHWGPIVVDVPGRRIN